MLCGSLEDELREKVVLQQGQAFDEHWVENFVRGAVSLSL